jgi:tRNA (cmo5U34)-methyltransferase
MGEIEFTPEDFLALMRHQIPLYDELQEQTIAATAEIDARRILELGFGTGETTRRLRTRYPDAQVVAVDGSTRMLAAAELPGVDLRHAELTEALPEGPFDLVVSCLTVHHLGAEDKRALFRRVAEIGEWLVFGGVVVPHDPAAAVTPLAPDYDLPDTTADQLAWLREAGFEAEVTWERADLAVIRAQRRSRPMTSRTRPHSLGSLFRRKRPPIFS